MKLTALILILSLVAGCAMQPSQDFMTMSDLDTSPVAVSDVGPSQNGTDKESAIVAAMLWIVLIAAIIGSDHYIASYHGDGFYIRSDNLDQ